MPMSIIRERLSGRFVRNLGSLGGAQLVMRLSRLAATVLLARVLSPVDYGLAAVVLTVYELVALFTRNGISAKVVQADARDVERVARTAHTLTWIICGTLVVVQAAVAVPVAWYYGHPELAMPVALMGLIYLVTPLCNIQAAFQQRDGRMGRIAATGAIQVVTDNILTAILALLGMGMWAIILPKLLVAPIWMIGVRTGHAWRPAPGWSLDGWRDIARFSRSVLGVELLATLQANIDNVIVGAVLGTEALGVYYFAFNAGLGITLGLVTAMGVAVYPHLCEVRTDRAALTTRYWATMRTLGALVVPIILVQALLAPIYVPIVFGARWEPAVPVLMLICLSALPRPFAMVTSQLLKAVGRPEVELRWQAAQTVVLVLAIAVGTRFGIIGVAAAILCVQAAGMTAYLLTAPRPFVNGVRPFGHREHAPTVPDRAALTLIADEEGLLALREEWDDLWSRAAHPHVSQGFAWCLAGWRTTGKPRGRRLCVAVMREAGRVVLIWPMTCHDRSGFTVARALGAESSEYAPVLVEAGADAGNRVAIAWSFLRRASGADVLNLPFAFQGAADHDTVAATMTMRVADALPAPRAVFGAGGWEAYWQSRSGNLRRGLTRRRRRLAESGVVRLEWIEDPTEFARLADWALARKREWMAHNHLANDFICTSEYRNFLLAMAARAGETTGLRLLVLRLDGLPIAVKIGCVDGSRFEGFITTYDPAFAALSPGQVILADCLEWCARNGLDYDFRIGDEAYKQDWATEDHLVRSFRVANSLRGALMLRVDDLRSAARDLQNRLRSRLPAAWRPRLKSLLARPRVPVALEVPNNA